MFKTVWFTRDPRVKAVKKRLGNQYVLTQDRSTGLYAIIRVPLRGAGLGQSGVLATNLDIAGVEAFFDARDSRIGRGEF